MRYKKIPAIVFMRDDVGLDQVLVNMSCKGPDSTHVSLYGLRSLSQLLIRHCGAKAVVDNT